MSEPSSPSPRRSGTVTGGVLVALLKTLWALFVVSTPVLGAWVASSIAAYQNRSARVAALVGLLLFPLLPLAWEALAAWRRTRARTTPRPRVLTFGDRLILRTLAVNLLFLGVLLATHPQVGFLALSTRGDWMLEGRRGPTAAAARRRLFAAAGGLEWLYKAARSNPYRRYVDPADRGPGPSPNPSGTDTPRGDQAGARPDPAPGRAGDAPRGEPPQGTAATPPAARRWAYWPTPDEPSPVVRAMPPEAEASIETIGRYIAERTPDAHARVRALHDYVADRIAYNAVAFATNTITEADADPETVLRNRRGVCAGYARLLAALGRVAGVDIRYVVGDVRGDATIENLSHAWNAVRLEGRWYLMDPTWDAGSVNGTTFTKRFRTAYFLAPPEVFGLDHFPDEAAWQLRDVPLTRGEFVRQPNLEPAFFARGFELRSPARSQVSARGALEVEVGNPRGEYFLASYVPAGGAGARTRCAEAEGAVVRIRCALPGPGTYRVVLFASPERYNHDYDSVASFEVTNQL